MSRKGAIIALTACLLVTAIAAFTLPNTFFDYDFEKFFKPSDPATAYFQEHRANFGTDNDYVLVAIENREGIFDPEFLLKIADFTAEAAKLPHVVDVTSPTNFKRNIREPLTGVLFERSLLTGDRARDSIAVSQDKTVMHNLFGDSLTALSIVLVTEAKLSKAKCDELASALKTITERFGFDETHLAGRAIGQVVYIKKISDEFQIFISLSLVFVVILLFAIFKSFRGVIIPLATVLLAVVWSIGILNFSGLGISILLNMLPPVIFVVGMSDAVHLYARYLEELRAGRPKPEAIRQMVRDTGLATFLTSLTTAIGFGSLYFTGIPALQEFGLITGAGVLAAFAIAITLLPALLVLLPQPRNVAQPANRLWSNRLRKTFLWIVQKRRPVIIVSVFITAFLAFFASQIELNNFILEDLKKSEPLRRDFSYFDTHFSGVRPFELGIKLPDSSGFLNPEHIKAIDQIEQNLRDDYGVSATVSLSTISKELNRMRKAGRADAQVLPDSDSDWKPIIRDLERLQKAGKIDNLISEDGNYTRISGRVGDWGARMFDTKNQNFEEYIYRVGYSEKYDLTITGTGTLIDRTNQNLVSSLGKGLGMAFLLISIIIGVLFRSVRMVIIALVPNIIPLIALGGIMALMGVQLKMSTSIIFTIAFGIAVDDTIHLLSRYRLELYKGRQPIWALLTAYTHTGKALILTTFILLGGFISMCFSSFQSTFYIGLLVSLTLLLALAFDMLLLPILLLPGKKKISV